MCAAARTSARTMLETATGGARAVVGRCTDVVADVVVVLLIVVVLVVVGAVVVVVVQRRRRWWWRRWRWPEPGSVINAAQALDVHVLVLVCGCDALALRAGLGHTDLRSRLGHGRPRAISRPGS